MLKLQYFGHLMQRADSLEMILGKVEGKRRRRRQRTRYLDGITDSMDMNLSNSGYGEGEVSWRALVHGVAEADMPECLSNEKDNFFLGLRRKKTRRM